jgi:hypothetical protein
MSAGISPSATCATPVRQSVASWKRARDVAPTGSSATLICTLSVSRRDLAPSIVGAWDGLDAPAPSGEVRQGEGDLH